MEDDDKVVLFDFNNLVFRNFFINEVGPHSEKPDFMLWRHNIFNTIYQALWKEKNIVEVVIAVDDKNSWRKSYFPRYKESRKKQRDKSDVNWELMFKNVDKLVSDLKHYMPFKIVKTRSAEADDVIAIIALNIEKIAVIISNDEDYLQLSSDRIQLYNPQKKKYVECNDTKAFLLEKIMTGQKKDDIFNIITPDDWGKTKETEGKNKPGFGPAALKKVLAEGLNVWMEKKQINKIYGEIDVKSNYKRNQILIDFNKIPRTIINRILDQYDNYNFPPPSNMFQFFSKYKMRYFLENFTQVEQKLMELY